MHTQPTKRSDRERALIIVADGQGSTMHVAQALGVRLRRQGHVVDVGDALAATSAPASYAAVILGAELGRAPQRRALADYISRHRDKLDQVTTGMFVLGDVRDGSASRHSIEAFENAVSWRPSFTASLSRPRPRHVRTLSQRLLTSLLRRLSGSKNVTEPDEVAELARVIGREVRRAR